MKIKILKKVKITKIHLQEDSIKKIKIKIKTKIPTPHLRNPQKNNPKLLIRKDK